jgi:hypothetical protein
MPLSVKDKIRSGEQLKQVANRVDEVKALVDALSAQGKTAEEMAPLLEHGFIFGTYGHNQHFLRSDFYTMILQLQAGKQAELRAEAVILEAALEAVEVKPKEKEK